MPLIGDLPIDKVTYAVIEDLKLALAKKQITRVHRAKLETARTLSPKTINNILTCLRRMLVVARKRGLIEYVPDIERLRAPEPEFDFLDFDEADRLVAAAEGQLRTMILVGLRTGMRHGELCALRWQDVDLVAGRIMVRQNVVRGIVGTPKSGKPREIALGDDVRAALKAHRHLRGPLVFCDMGGKMLTDSESKNPLAHACKRAGLRSIGWHCLRHTFASHLAMRGATLKVIQDLLGHSTIVMTMRTRISRRKSAAMRFGCSMPPTVAAEWQQRLQNPLTDRTCCSGGGLRRRGSDDDSSRTSAASVDERADFKTLQAVSQASDVASLATALADAVLRGDQVAARRLARTLQADDTSTRDVASTAGAMVPGSLK